MKLINLYNNFDEKWLINKLNFENLIIQKTFGNFKKKSINNFELKNNVNCFYNYNIDTFDLQVWKKFSDFSFSRFVKRNIFSPFELRLKSTIVDFKPGWIEEQWPKYKILNFLNKNDVNEKIELLIKKRSLSIFYYPTSDSSVYIGNEFRKIVFNRRSNIFSENIDLIGFDYYTNIVKQDEFLNKYENYIFVGKLKFGEFCFTKKNGSKIHFLKKKKIKK